MNEVFFTRIFLIFCASNITFFNGEYQLIADNPPQGFKEIISPFLLVLCITFFFFDAINYAPFLRPKTQLTQHSPSGACVLLACWLALFPIVSHSVFNVATPGNAITSDYRNLSMAEVYFLDKSQRLMFLIPVLSSIAQASILLQRSKSLAIKLCSEHFSPGFWLSLSFLALTPEFLKQLLLKSLLMP